MKKIIALILATASLLTFTCCDAFDGAQSSSVSEMEASGSTETSSIEEKQPLKTVEEIMAETSAEDLSCAAYDREKYLASIWDSQIVYNETVCFIQNEDGSFPVEQLAYPIAKVLEIRDSTLGTLYTEGVDYEIVEGGIRLLENTSVEHFQFNDFYLKDRPTSSSVVKSLEYSDRYLKLGDGGYFYSRQTCVTYIRTTEYDGPKVRTDYDLIPNTIEKLENKEEINMVYFGDSITTGSSVSGWQFANIAPYTPIFSDMITEKLKDYYGYDKINVKNTAVGGWTASGAKDSATVTDMVIQHNPDLVVLAFGMNDAGGTVNSNFRQAFETNIETIISYVRRFLPDCEFILVSTMLPNPDAEGTLANHRACKEALENLVDAYEGIALADMTTMSDWLLKRKGFHDMGDNLVHPTDFLSRIYAQVILSNLIKDFN